MCVCDCVGLCVGCQDSIGGTLTGQSRSSWVRDSDMKGDHYKCHNSDRITNDVGQNKRRSVIVRRGLKMA